MSRTHVTGVGDPISIPNGPPDSPGTTLWVGTVPKEATWTLENFIYSWGVVDEHAGKFILHVFVTDSFGHTLSPIWDYAWLQSQHPEWWRPIMLAPHMPVHGPATVSVVAVNIANEPINLYWSALWTLEP